MSTLITMRGAVTALLAGAFVAAALQAGCGGGGKPAGAAGADGGAGTGGAGMDGGEAGEAIDAKADGTTDVVLDLATDFADPPSDVAINCPTGGGVAAPAGVLIDDFQSGGRLNGRSREGQGFTVKEQFDATADARFDPVPGVEARCGAAAPGAAHIRGAAADTGATFALIFSGTGAGGKPVNRYDASATKGVRFRVALGDAKATKLLTVSVNVADSLYDYTKDVIVGGTAWQDVEVRWSELQAAAAAPAFSAAGVNQIVFPLIPHADVDLYIDDMAFIP
jgi:hypothetical protein